MEGKKERTRKDGTPIRRKPRDKEATAERRRLRMLAEESGGKNAIFFTAREFEEAANAYFDDCDAKGKLYGEAGLCLALSRANKDRRTVRLETLRTWYDGKICTHLQDAVQKAYLRIQEQIDTDPTYREKGMVPRSIFLQKQSRLGGYQDKVETKSDATVKVVFGNGVEMSDFQ